MKKTMINRCHVEGIIYEHTLETAVTGPNSKNPGSEYIRGTLSVATDDAGINIVPVYFSYVAPKTSKGTDNATYIVLKNIIDGVIGTQMKNGKENAGKVRIDTSIGVNDFYTDRNGKVELITAKRNEGGFVHTCDVLAEDEKTRSTFECDMLITDATRLEAVEDRGIPERVIVKGAVFDFRNTLLPVEFTATNVNAMNYFEDLGATSSTPVFTKVWGRQVSEVIVRRTEEESAFGDAAVRETKTSRKDFVITGAAKEPYIWDDEGTITANELAQMIAARETYLASVKQRFDESKNKTATPAAPAQSDFKF